VDTSPPAPARRTRLTFASRTASAARVIAALTIRVRERAAGSAAADEGQRADRGSLTAARPGSPPDLGSLLDAGRSFNGHGRQTGGTGVLGVPRLPEAGYAGNDQTWSGQ
jgi:hypothetical protein